MAASNTEIKDIHEMMMNMERKEHDGIFDDMLAYLDVCDGKFVKFNRRAEKQEEEYQKLYKRLIEIGTNEKQLKITKFRHESWQLIKKMRRLTREKVLEYLDLNTKRNNILEEIKKLE
eukprot:Seg22537.1 transcript_id=Seg22537.1/GoldUCD/mRNA.D3Y31 product="hypothetical protein" protein_id=Seg22537.1/GoldUCD/D3Y31